MIDEEPPAWMDDGAPVESIEDGRARIKARARKRKAHAPACDAASIPWASLLLLDEKGKPKSTAANAATYLAHDPQLAGLLELRVRAGDICWTREPPLPEDVASPGPWPRVVTDADLVALASYLERTHGVSFGGLVLSSAIDAVAARHAVDPVRSYLDSLAWDGERRLDTWLRDMLGVEDGAYSRAVGIAWLVSAVARTYRPGCQADHVLVLEGVQGAGKSSAIKTLAGEDEWYADGVPGIGSKDAADALRGPWLVEIAELDAFSRAELGTVKAFVSRRSDRYREAYGRRTLNHPRRVVFAATTNDTHYLRDATGARRFWPVACGTIDLRALAEHRDQLWAEAAERFRAGASWHLAGDLADAARQETDHRYQGDAWEAEIEAYLSMSSTTTVREVAVFGLEMDVAKLDQGTQQRIARALTRLGWAASKHTERRVIGGKPCKVRVYRQAVATVSPPPTSPQQGDL
jgi:putative DNA primase/helicase